MAFTPNTPEALEQAQVASYSNRFEGKDTSPESFLGKLARAEAAGLWAFEKRLQRISLDTVPNEQSTYERLSDWATVLGVPDGAGSYGPLNPTIATGLAGTATGTAGTLIPSGTQLVAADGETLFATTANATIGGGGSVTIAFNALTAGTAGNLQVPASLTFVSPPGGVNASVTLTTGADNAIDTEGADALLDRILLRLRFPPKGGAIQDYIAWAQEVSGVGPVYVYPRRAGTGTVQVAVTQAGTGTGRIPGGTLITEVNDHLADVMPVDVDGAVDPAIPPYHTSTHDLTVRVYGVTPSLAKYAWDWTDPGTYTVAGWNAGTRALTLNAAAPATLIAALPLLPRVQVLDTGGGPGQVVPAQLRVSAITAPANIILTITAASIPTGFNPQVGDRVYAGGPMAQPIGQALLDYIDSLGPSRESGYGDTTVAPWDDTVAIAQLMRIALDVTDEDGVRLAKNLSGTPIIAVGAGAPASTDYTPPDNTVNGPEIAVAKFVVCTQ